MMNVTIAMTGASGNMGSEALRQLLELDQVSKIKLLLLNGKREKKLARSLERKEKSRVEIIWGDVSNLQDVNNLIKDADYVLNLCAVIPPLADHFPKKAEECNVFGVKNIVSCIESVKENQPKLVHISSVAVYGNRNYKHPWGRVGDPVMSDPYDAYSATKIRGERLVLDSEVKNWVILRQTGILHKSMLTSNMKDGLMFHTCFNTPIEWVTAKDSGLLIKNLIEKDTSGKLEFGFWKRCYNIGGGKYNRMTGYDTFNQGFNLIGGSAEKFMKPAWNSIRNFHCVWFQDSDVLNGFLDFQKQKVSDYWQEIIGSHRYYKLAGFLPPKLISKLVIERLLSDENSPRQWIKTNQVGRIKAYFGSPDNIDCLPEKWEDFPLLAHGQIADGGIDYDGIRDISKVRENGFVLNHGYDESKSDADLSIDDMKQAAAFRGGECLSEKMTKGDLDTKLLWRCHDGHEFMASPYCILKAGHWCPKCTIPEPWDYDRLSKFMPFYGQVWYDTHAKNENCKYFFDKNHNAKYEIFE